MLRTKGYIREAACILVSYQVLQSRLISLPFLIYRHINSQQNIASMTRGHRDDAIRLSAQCFSMALHSRSVPQGDAWVVVKVGNWFCLCSTTSIPR